MLVWSEAHYECLDSHGHELGPLRLGQHRLHEVVNQLHEA